MAVLTTLAQLEEVQAAISKVLRAQKTGVGNNQLLRADLEALTARENSLLTRYKSEQGTGGITLNQGIYRRSR